MAEVADYNARAALIKIEQLQSEVENLKSENDDLARGAGAAIFQL